eukprot:g4406.t1
MSREKLNSRRFANSTTRPSTSVSSFLAKRVEEKLDTYRNDAEAREELEARIARFKRRPDTAPPAAINYLKTNVAHVSVPISQQEWPVSDRRPTSASCPGVGGSPTAREDYLKHSARRHSAASVRHEMVREKRDAELRLRYERKVASANRAMLIRGRSAVERQLALEREQSMQRCNAWHTIVALCCRLEAMKELLITNRHRRAIYLREKEAAVKIATWFKAKLIERRRFQLIESCRRFHQFSTAAVQQNKKRIRKKCALRILDFIQKEINTTQMMSAIQKLLRYTVLIQRCWRSLVVSRQAQVELLNLQLAKFEGHLLTYNRKKASGNTASVFVAGARRACPLHEDLKAELMRVTGAVRRTESPPTYSTHCTSRQRRVKMDDEEDDMTPQQMLFLNTLTVRLPKSIKDQVVAERLAEEIRRFYHKWDRYTAEKKVYVQQKPIDDARMNLLRSAGIETDPQVIEPNRPKLRVLQSVSGLSYMMEQGLRTLINTNPQVTRNRRASRTNMKLPLRR